MANPLIGEILGSVLGGGMRGGMGAGLPGGNVPGMGGMGGLGGLGSVLGGMLGGGLAGARPNGVPAGGRGGNHGAMLAMMLPLVMSWIQRNGGLQNVLGRVQQQGYGSHASSWVGTGENQQLPPDAAHQLLGQDELASLSGQLGIGQDEAAQGFSDILPQLVDHLSPQGHVPEDADQRLDAGQSALDRMLQQVR